jgi:glucosyl-dolichyl phosphate glucuronosyltransferase
MTQSAYHISVIICAYSEDRWNELIAAVGSVQQQTLPPGEIIVVIDHNPGLLKRVRENVPGVVVVENTEAHGLSGARNSGIAVAKSQVVAFLDDDAIASPGWLMILNEAFSDPKVLGVGGAVLPRWVDDEPTWLPEEFHWIVGCTYRGMPQSTARIRNPIGANMSFRREVFETLGGFRSGLGRVSTRPLGCEETELCIRACQLWPHSTFLYQPHASVFHRVPANRTCWGYFCSRCFSEGLSKAAVARYVGITDSLSSERTYTCQTLPRGFFHGITDALFRFDLSGFLRTGAIVVGLGITMMGYLVGTIAQRSVLRKKVSAGAKLPFQTITARK